MNDTSLERRTHAGTEVVLCKYAACDSTNDLAADLLRDVTTLAAHGVHESTPVIVLASMQHKGRGRRGKEWIGNADENLYLSVGLRPSGWTSHLADYQILGCLAVRRALSRFVPSDNIVVKYPNDILLRDRDCSPTAIPRKVCGVLVETEFRGSDLSHVICGIGVNVNQQHFLSPNLHTATSLREVTGEVMDVTTVSDFILDAFFSLLDTSADEVFKEWKDVLALEGTCIKCERDEPPSLPNDSSSLSASSSVHRVVNVERDGTLRVRDIVDGVEETIDHILSPLTTTFRVIEDTGVGAARE